MTDQIGYEKEKCHFNFPGCEKTHAGYQRREDGGTRQYFDACENCARQPYKHDGEQPEQLRKEKSDVNQSNG